MSRLFSSVVQPVRDRVSRSVAAREPLRRTLCMDGKDNPKGFRGVKEIAPLPLLREDCPDAVGLLCP